MHGWRAHLGKISLEPIEAWVTREFYEVMPEGIDITIALLQTRKSAPKGMDDFVELVGHLAKLLAERGADVVYLDGILPIVMRHPGYDQELIAELEKLTGRKASTGITAAIEAFRALGIQRLVMSSLFEEGINDRIKTYVAASGFDIVHMRSLPKELKARHSAQPDELEYTFTRQVVREHAKESDGIYIPCGGWGTVRNVARLEQDLGKAVVTWQTAMMWWFLKNTGVKARIRGYGSLLEMTSA